MSGNYINLETSNIDKEHLCCAISDKKCKESYELKRTWLKNELDNEYVFRKLDVRAKVFIEYGPAEKGWVPVDAPNYLLINCFWVSGRYKGKGYGKELLKGVIQEAIHQGKSGLVTVVGTSKFHFMSDTKWLLKQGFVECQRIPTGFSLLVLKIDPDAKTPNFKESVIRSECDDKKGIVVYYSNRCPFAEFHVKTSLLESATKRNLPYKFIKLETMEQAQSAPSPATIFSLFYNGEFITTDISICMDSRFDKLLERKLK